PTEAPADHCDNNDGTLVELPRDIGTLVEEPPRIGLDDLCHHFQSLLKILPHDSSPWVRAKDHPIPGLEQCGDDGLTVEGNGSVRHRRRVTLPCRGVEHDLPVGVSTLEFFPDLRNGSRSVELRPSHVKHALITHSIERLFDPLSGGLPGSENEVIGLELVRDHRDLFTLTVAEVHM